MFNAARLHAPLAKELRAAFDDVLSSGRFIGGDKTAQFERELAAMHGVFHTVGTSSGTDALIAALQAVGVGPGDEVITTPYTFFATAGSIARLGARPVFVDIDPLSFNIDPSLIAAAITEKTVGILPVHLFGQCADMDAVLDIANEHDLWVLEDAAQSIGAILNGRLAGTMSSAGILSFFPAKNLGALGDAGAVITNDNELADRVSRLRNHGAVERYRHELIGGNFRLDALQAAFLSIKLRYLPIWQESRREIALRYREAFCMTDQILLPTEIKNARHVYNQFVIRTEKRDALCAALSNVGIETAVYYPMPLHLQPCFEYLGYEPCDFPHAERAARMSLALPMDPLLTEDEQQSVIGAIIELC
jgi:dTDP-4-amino-4,6-dideoxygalactose transaminase